MCPCLPTFKASRCRTARRTKHLYFPTRSHSTRQKRSACAAGSGAAACPLRNKCVALRRQQHRALRATRFALSIPSGLRPAPTQSSGSVVSTRIVLPARCSVRRHPSRYRTISQLVCERCAKSHFLEQIILRRVVSTVWNAARVLHSAVQTLSSNRVDCTHRKRF